MPGMALATVFGRKVYYEVHGTGTGAPLVLVTGIALPGRAEPS
jgi:hypothetical protein